MRTLGGPGEMLFLGDRDEVLKMAQLHDSSLWLLDSTVLFQERHEDVQAQRRSVALPTAG
jgi:hypothetical protein